MASRSATSSRRAKVAQRERYLWKRYGLTPAQDKKMEELQRGLCKICLQKRRLYIDHDHKTGRVRGKICFRDNHRLLGRGLESAWLHEQAALYLLSTFDGRSI